MPRTIQGPLPAKAFATDMKTTALLLTAALLLTPRIASSQESSMNKETGGYAHSAWPFALGAGVVTLAYCEYGPDDCRTNTARLWGAALVISAGLFLWTLSSDNRTRLGIGLTPEYAPLLIVEHRFGG